MADITQPNIVNFLGDMRSVANSIYHSKAVWDDLISRYHGQGISTDLGGLQAGDIIIDGAETNGWGVSTVGDMQTFASRVDQLGAVLDAAFAMDIVNLLRTQAVT